MDDNKMISVNIVKYHPNYGLFSAPSRMRGGHTYPPLLCRTQKSHYNSKQKTRLGLIAQEVGKAFPELVETDEDGILYVDYIGHIPALIEGLKEMQTKVDNMQAQEDRIVGLEKTIEDLIENCCNLKVGKYSAIISDKTGNKEIAPAVLYQNIPNPFTSQTVIRYEIPEKSGTSQLHIFNMSGNLLKTVPINTTGNGSTVFQGSEFSPGMYLYSLVINGQIIDTKQMLLTR